MTLAAIAAFTDNYIWMWHDGRRAAVVDPGDAQPVFDALQRQGLQLAAILVTHHHADHVGGVAALREATDAEVWGPATETIPQPSTRVRGGDRIEVLGTGFDVIDVPGHTAGHIAYFGAEAPGGPVLFCGDTLFSAGCGRLFEGTPAQMLASLDALATLPDATRVCCGHEYTLSNLRFAQAVEPDNADIAAHISRCETLRADGLATLPAELAAERRINPFLRSRTPAVRAAIARFARHFGADAPADDASGFAVLRQWKNDFR